MGLFNFFAFLMLAVTVKSLQQEHPSKYNTVSEPEPKMHYEEMIEFVSSTQTSQPHICNKGIQIN